MSIEIVKGFPPPFLFSNTSTKDWKQCRRKFYLRYLYEGRGLTGVYVDEDLLFGSLIHTGMEHLWLGDVGVVPRLRHQLQDALLNDPIWNMFLVGGEREEKAKEWGRLLMGMLYAAHQEIIPYFKRGYELKWVEADAVKWLRNHPRRIGLMAKPDTLLEGDGVMGHPGLGYLEWKTAKAVDGMWAKQWVRNPQTWTGAITLEAAAGIRPEWFTVVGLVKGNEYKGRRVSPFCWAYWRNPAIAVKGEKPEPDQEVEAADGSRWRWAYTAKKGWMRRSTDDFPGGLEQWIASLPWDVVRSQFAITEPIEIEWDLAEEWVRNQNASLGETVEKFSTGALDVDTAFPRELSECEVGAYGKPCTFRELCHNAAVGKDPIGSGKYMWRRPHHQIEVSILEGHHGEAREKHEKAAVDEEAGVGGDRTGE